MYCGDETGAFVGDVGYSTCKFGYGGEDLPKSVIPSVVGQIAISSSEKATTAKKTSRPSLLTGQGSISRYRPNLDLRYIYKRPNYDDQSLYGDHNPGGTSLRDGSAYLEHDGVISDWDAWQACWEKAFIELRVRDSTKWSSPSQIASWYKKRNIKPTLGNIKADEEDNSTRKEDTKLEAKASLSADIASSIYEGPCPHPICATDSGFTYYPYNKGAGQRQREHMLERLFESFDAPGVFIIPSAPVSAFSVGRPTSLVVDIGGGGCRATPIFDGLILRQSQRRSGRGGEWVSDQQYAIITRLAKQAVHPRYAIQLKRKNSEQQTQENNSQKEGKKTSAAASKSSDNKDHAGGTRSSKDKNKDHNIPYFDYNKVVQYPSYTAASRSFYWNAIHDLMYEMKTSPHVSTSHEDDDNPTNSEKNQNAIKSGSSEILQYELPDGTNVDLKAHPRLERIPDLFFTQVKDPFFQFLFSPTTLPAQHGTFGNNSYDNLISSHSTLTNIAVQEMIHESLSAVDVDVRKELCSNIVLVGASSLFPNLETRLSEELTNRISPTFFKTKVIASKSQERQFSSWIGASVLTSLGSFQQMWCSRAEYEELGVTLASRKFPS